MFSNQSTSSTIFAQLSSKLAEMSPNLPENNEIKAWSPIPKVYTFCKVKAYTTAILRRYSHILPKISRDFAQILSDFARIFTKSKVFGVRFHPLTPRPPTPVSINVRGSSKLMSWFSPTFSGALVQATVLTLLLKSFAEKKSFESRRFS